VRQVSIFVVEGDNPEVEVRFAPVLRTMQVSPSAPALKVGTSAQASATGTISDGASRDLTRLAAWTADAPGVATVTADGLITVVSSGTAVVTATLAGVSASLTATARPGNSPPLGSTREFAPTG